MPSSLYTHEQFSLSAVVAVNMKNEINVQYLTSRIILLSSLAVIKLCFVIDEAFLLLN